MSKFSIFTVAAAIALAGCNRNNGAASSQADPSEAPESKTRTRETNKLGQAIDEYAAHPGAEAAAEVKKRFAILDGELAELELFVAKSKGAEREEATAKLHNLQAYRAAEAIRFGKLPNASSGPIAAGLRSDARAGAAMVEQKARDLGDTLETGAERAGNSIKEAAERTKDAVKDAVQ